MTASSRLLLATLLIALSGSMAFAADENEECLRCEAMAQARNAVAKAGAPGTEAGPEAAGPEKPALSKTPTALPDSPSAVAMEDPATRQKYLDAVGRYYEYRLNGFEFRSRVFDWQLLSSRVIFVVVVLLVLAGIYFSAVQFHVALITARRTSERAAAAPSAPAATAAPSAAVEAKPAPPSPFATQLEISAKGIIVNSSVLGVIVLALSLAFFYFYLVYVYPIKDTL
jgi:hypothetical protein